MGGVITKWYVSDLGYVSLNRRNSFPQLVWRGDLNPYHRNNNFGVGDIRRLVSMGSPFQGSPFADKTSESPVVAWLAQHVLAGDGNAFDDLVSRARRQQH